MYCGCYRNPALPLATPPPNLDIIWQQAEQVVENNLFLPNSIWAAIEHAVSYLHVHQIGSYISGFDPYQALEPEILEKKVKNWMSAYTKQFMVPGSEGEPLLEMALREHIHYRIPLFDRARKIYDLHPERLQTGNDVPGFEDLETFLPATQPEYLKELGPLCDEVLFNTAIVELNQGCSVRCNFCAFDAARKVTDIMPFSDAIWLLRRLNELEALNRDEARIFFYYATDPLDYPYYRELFLLHRLLAGNYPFTSTAYPQGQEEQFLSMVERIQRLSLSHMNYKRLARDGLITPTPKKGFVPNTPDLRESLFFGFLSGSGQDEFSYNQFQKFKARFTHPSHVLTHYLIELYRKPHEFYNLLLPQPNKEWMRLIDAGRYRTSESEVTQSLGCRDGVILTTYEARNTVKLHSTQHYPKGYVESVLTLSNLYDGHWQAKQATHIEELLPYCIVKPATRYSTVKLELQEHPELNFYTFQNGKPRYNLGRINRVTGDFTNLDHI